MDWSRRRALSAVAVGLSSVAGCSAADEGSSTPGHRESPVESYEVERVREETGAVLFARDGEIQTPDEEEERGRWHDSAYVVSPSDLEAVAFGDGSAARRLRSFAAETDFEGASVFLFATRVDACHDVRLETVTLDRDGDPHGDFCGVLRPADVDCTTDDVDTVGYAVRLPVARESSGGHGHGMSSSCRRSGHRVAFEAEVTPADGGERS